MKVRLLGVVEQTPGAKGDIEQYNCSIATIMADRTKFDVE